jgi:RNA polymerase sigma factor (sigma-70 family)
MSDRPVPPQRGDEEELFERYKARLHTATRLAINTTSEIVDDACAFAWMQFIACQPRRTTAFAWLKTVARNEALRLDRLARERTSAERSLDVNEHTAQLVRARDGRVEVAADFRDLRDRLLELSPRQREIVLLNAAGWRLREVAAHLGLSEQRVGHLVVRAVERMRAMDEREVEARSQRGRRLRDVENAPPRYILAALGREPAAHSRDGQWARREWKRLVLQIEDYREANGVTDEVLALGRGERVPPANLIARSIAGYRRERGLSMGIEL